MPGTIGPCAGRRSLQCREFASQARDDGASPSRQRSGAAGSRSGPRGHARLPARRGSSSPAWSGPSLGPRESGGAGAGPGHRGTSGHLTGLHIHRHDLRYRPMDCGRSGLRQYRDLLPHRAQECCSGLRMPRPSELRATVKTRRSPERKPFSPCCPARPRVPWRIEPRRCAACAVAPPTPTGSTAPPMAAPASSSSTRPAASPTARSAATPAASTDLAAASPAPPHSEPATGPMCGRSSRIGRRSPVPAFSGACPPCATGLLAPWEPPDNRAAHPAAQPRSGEGAP